MDKFVNTRDRRGQELVPYEPVAITDHRPYPEAEPLPGHGMVPLQNYWHIIVKRRWTILTTIVVLTTTVAIASFRMTPIFRAASRVQVEAETPLVQSLNDIYQKTDTDDVFLETQIEVLKSENLAWQTIEELRLEKSAVFINPAKVENLDPQRRKVVLIKQFQDRLEVALVPKTRILSVGFESSDPNLAAHVCNALVNNYIDYSFRQKYDATRQASGWMEQQLDELKAKVEKSQEALVAYEQQHAIATVGTKDRQSIEEQMLSDLSKDLTTAQGDRIAKESLYNQVRTNRSQIAALAHNDLLQKLEETGSQLKQQIADTQVQYGPKYPKLLRLKDELADNQAQIAAEQNRVIERIRNDYVTAVNREKLAVAAANRQREALGNSNQLLVQRNILQREFDANQQLYQNLMQRLKDATVSAGLRSTNIHQVDTALAPDKPIRPRKLLNISLGFFAGIVIGVLLAFVQEGIDHSIKTAEEVEAILGVPSLGIIPQERISGRKVEGARVQRALRGRSQPTEGIALSVVQMPDSAFAEAFRALRTSILLSLHGPAAKTLLITSAQSGDGKTTSSFNLAAVLAQRKGPVLLIDADMRRAGISKAFNLSLEKGLSSVLGGIHKADDVLRQHESLPELWMMSAGPVPPSAADLLSSDKMAQLIKEFNERFEHIVIDSPPILSVTDATILSRMVDGVVLVVQSGATSRGGLLRTVRTLESAGATILGMLMNKFDPRQHGYYDYHYSGYYGYAGLSRYGDRRPYGVDRER